MYSHYVHIYDMDMSDNDERLRCPYNAEAPLEGIMKIFNKCADFLATASKPLSEKQVVHLFQGLVAETGQHPEYRQAWIMQEKNTERPSRPTSLKHNTIFNSSSRHHARVATEPTTCLESSNISRI